MIEVVSLGRRTVRLRPSLARGASSIAVIASGGSEGREGPIIQIGAACASALARGGSVSRADPDPHGLRDGGRRRGRVQHADRGDALRPRGRRRLVRDDALRPGGRRGGRVDPVRPRRARRRAGLQGRALRVSPSRIRALSGDRSCTAGASSVLFVRMLSAASAFRRTQLPVWVAMPLGGAIVGAIAVFMPEVFGNGFEATDRILHGNPAPPCSFFSSSSRKTVATCATIGSGGVGGVFTPSLLVGATSGGSSRRSCTCVLPHIAATVGGYALLGMGGHARRRDAGAASRGHHDVRADAELRGPGADDGGLRLAVARPASPEGLHLHGEHPLRGHRLGEDSGATALASLKVYDIMRRDVALIPSTTPLPELVTRFSIPQSLPLRRGRAGEAAGSRRHPRHQRILSGAGTFETGHRRGPPHEIPFVTPLESLSAVNEKIWFRDLGSSPWCTRRE